MKRQSRADFQYRLGILPDRKLLMIQDMDLGNKSVINDIDNVVADIATKEQIDPNQYLIIYRDSQGIWDGWDATTRDFFPLAESHRAHIADNVSFTTIFPQTL